MSGRQPFEAPCDRIINAIPCDERRAIADALLMYVVNTRGGVPSDAARMLSRLTLKELTALQIAADRRCEIECGNVPAGNNTG